MTEKPRPNCRAIVLCDVIYRDEQSKKLILVGTFHVIHTIQLPAVQPSMSLYLAMNEGKGDYKFRIVVEHVATQQKVYEGSGTLSFSDPSQLVEVNAPINGLPLQNDGKYDIQVWTDDNLIGQTSFFVNVLEAR